MIRKENPHTSQWSGGTTTELYISPQGATVTERNFDLRISTATVDAEESDFTLFHGYLRKLIILEGQLEIQHDSQAPLHFHPGMLHAFSGDSVTHSKGKVRDFNVIHLPSVEPEIENVQFSKGFYDFGVPDKKCVLYLLSGEVLSAELSFIKGDTIIIEEKTEQLEVKESCTLVQVLF